MFTSIQKLRASSAMQSRVTTVENWLKRQNPNWTPESRFPIAFIAHSNAVDDVDWVNGSTNTHVSWPELSNEVLKEFGHKTQVEHRNAIEELLRSREGKTKVLNEQIVPKYNAAFARIGAADFGAAFWPFAKPAPIAVQATATPATNVADGGETAHLMSTPANAARLNESVAQLNAGKTTEHKLVPTTAPATEWSFLVIGAFYIAIGKIVILKEKTFDEACQWASSPTGGRTYSQFAMENGADGVEARAFLKAYMGRQAAK